MLRTRYAVSVAIITSAALGRRRSSRPVGYAAGNIVIAFPTSGRRENSIGISPTGILDPLGAAKAGVVVRIIAAANRGFSFMARTPGGASILVLKWPLPVTEFAPWFTHPSKLVSCLRLRLASSLAKPSLRPPFGCRTLRL